MRARKSWSEWSAIVEAYERSGQSHLEFCSKRGLKVASFRVWLYRVRKAQRAIPEVALVSVELAERASSTSVARASAATGLVIAVADVEVRLAVGTDVGYVACLVAELRSRC